MRRDEVDWSGPAMRVRVGARIKRAVTQTPGLTLKQLAEEVLHCSPVIVYQYVSGVRAVPLEQLEQIAARTNHSIEWFLRDAEPAESTEAPARSADVELSLLRRDFFHWKEIVDALDLPFADPHAALTRRLSYLERLVSIARIAAEADPRFRSEYAKALLRLGRARTEQFAFQEALGPLEEALALLEDIARIEDDPTEKAQLLQSRDLAWQALGTAYEGLGQPDRALAYFTAVEQKSSSTLSWLGRMGLCAVYIRQLNLEAAFQMWQSVMEELTDPKVSDYFVYAQPYLLGYLAGITELAGDYRNAPVWYRLALQNPPSEGRGDYLLEGLLEQGEALLRGGLYSDARIPIEAARLLSLAIRDRWHESRALSLQALIAAALGQAEEARTCAVQATAAAGQARHPVAQIHALLASAEVSWLEAQPEQALLLVQQALSLAQNTPQPRGRIAAAILQTRLLTAAARAGGRAIPEAHRAASELLYLVDSYGWRWAHIQARLLYAETLLLSGEQAQAETMADQAAEMMKRSATLLTERLLTTSGWDRLGITYTVLEDAPSSLTFHDPVVRLAFLALRARLTGGVDREAIEEIGEEVASRQNVDDARTFRETGWPQWLREAGLDAFSPPASP